MPLLTLFEPNVQILISLIRLQHRQKRFLGDADLAHLLHAFLAFGLLGQKLAFAGDVAALALGGHVFADRRDGFTSDDPAADRRLDYHLEKMPVNFAAQLFDQLPATAFGRGAMHDRRQGIDPLAGDQYIEPHQVRGAKAQEVVVHRAVAMCHGLELVVEIVNNFSQRQLVNQDGAGRAQVLGANKGAPAFGGHLHQIADVFHREQKADPDDGFPEFLDLAGIGNLLRIVDDERLTFARQDLVSDVRRGLHEVELAITFEALLNDLAMQHAQETATESKSQALADFRHISKGGVVESQFAEGFAQFLEIVVVDWIETAEDHWLRLFVTGQRRFGWMQRVGDGVANVYIGQVLDLGHEETDLPRGKRIDRRRRGAELADVGNVVLLVAAHEKDALPFADRSLHDTDINDDAFVRIKMAVIDERLERSVGVAFRRRNALDDGPRPILPLARRTSSGLMPRA